LFDITQSTLVECPGGLTSVIIPASVTYIGEEAFSGCTGLTSVTIPASVANIGEWAFNGCTGLTSVTIPASVTGISDYAFANCANLASVYFQGNAPTADWSVFVFYNYSATAYYLPSTTGWNAFSVNTGVSPVLWNPVIQTGDGIFGVQNSQFGFNITGTNNFAVVVEVCTNLANPVWVPLTTNTLVNGSVYFSEPVQENSCGRFYGLGLP
jgi:hypothetical protein